MAELERSLKDAGVFVSHDLEDMELGLETWIRMRLTPFPVLSQIFKNERELGYHLSKYKDLLEQTLPDLAPLHHREGGRKHEKGIAFRDLDLIPDLVFTAPGSRVVCDGAGTWGFQTRER